MAFVGILMTGYTTVYSQNIQGVAPVSTPKLGDAIDGNAFAHQPLSSIYFGVGDLFDSDHPLIGGHGLINIDPTSPDVGKVFYPPVIQPPSPAPPIPQPVPVTIQLKDRYLNDLTIFTKSNKINDNPNTYEWGAGSSPNKNEIQNCGAHFSYGDPDNFPGPGTATIPQGRSTDLWCLFAGDRQVTNGSSYIDFEFLQAPLTITGATYGPIDPLTNVSQISGGSGFFHTEAPDSTGGRTPGDILITIEFTQGGGDANVVIRKWELVGSTYQYVVYPNSNFAGQIFCTNNDEDTFVPFDVYGSGATGTYAPNQWAEGAINLTQVLTFFKNNCTSISTLFIRTRTSGNSAQSELKDFPGAPIQLNLNFRPDPPTTTNVTVCGPGPVQVNLSASGCTGGTLKWYDAATGGTKVNEGLTYSPTISTTTSYWVSCTSASDCEGPRTQVTATVNIVNPGVIAGDQTLCTPFDPAAFTNTTPGSASDGGVITYQWQISTTGCNGTWSDISGATSATYDAGAVSVITNFRRVTTATLNGVACSANSNCLTVTPNPITPGVIAGSQIGCTPFDAVAFTSTTPGSSTGVGVISYQWQMSTNGCEGTWANIVGATSATFDPPAVSVITNYRRVATSTLNGVMCSANSNCLTVTPTGIVPGEIAGNQTLCSPFDPAPFTSVTPGSDHGTITYQWQSSIVSAVAGFANIAGATSETYDAPAVAVKTWFRRVASSDVGCSANSNVLVVTPNDITPGTIAGNQTLCTPFDPAAFTNTTPGSTTNGGTISYQWQMSTNGCEGTWTNIQGATSATYDAGAVSVITNFRRVATSTLNGVMCSANSNCLTVTPNPITPGVIAGSQIGCTPFDAVAFTSTTPGSSTGVGVISYQWQMSTNGCEGTWANILGATSATFDPPAVSVITNYRRVATSTLNGVMCSANSNCLTVTPTGIVPGEIAGNQTLCSPFDPAPFTSVTPGSDHGTITYQWQSSIVSAVAGFANIAGATSETYDAPAVAVKTWFRRVASSDVGCSANSNILVVTPNDITPGTIAGNQTLCTPFDPAAFTNTTPGSTTNGGTISYQWQMSTNGCEGTWTNIQGATSATYDAGAISVITNFRRVATSTLNGVMCSANSNCLTVTPNPITPGVIAGSQTKCGPFDPDPFTSTTDGSSTGIGVISYQWQISTNGCEGPWTNIPGATSATYDPSTVSATTNYRRVATSTLNGVMCSANSNCLTVTPGELPTPFTLHDLEICAPLPLNLRSAILDALPDPLVESVTFWRDVTAMNDEITGNNITNYTASVGVHTIYIRLTFVATGCTRVQQFSVDVKSCSAALCTYTQGAYGNAGGMSCSFDAQSNMYKQYSTVDLIKKALTSYPSNTMTIGSSTRGILFTYNPILNDLTDVNAIIQYLPGGGSSKVIRSGDLFHISEIGNNDNKGYYLKNGKINNTLLAQTITLGLNIGIDGALGNLALQPGTFAVAEPEGGCGSNIPKTRQCSPGGFTPVINEYKYYTIPTKVINALSTKSVQGLFALANQALAGGSTNGLTLSEIASAVDLINNAFDECRIFVGYGIEPLVCMAPPIGESLIGTNTSRIADTNTFIASPVPFKDQLTVSYNFDFVTDVRIEVFNTNGYVVAKSYDTNGYLNKSVLLNIPGTGQEEVYVIKLTTNKGSSTQKVLSSR
ncbi:hypothetical protein EM308_08985 [Flavobacterium gilvum]|uniref:Ig-like domain-containing protein n=4 Tax=Flavobacterium gilvum TaxID=1492737 RepID=A0AAC9N5E6_9FLAO|nr:hypothetical protein EM308_08985 [Flavobacterium gilvum]